MSGRPLVAVTVWRRSLPTYLGEQTDLYTLGTEYADALREAGLVPLLVTEAEAGDAVAVLDAVDGLVLTGGEDVHPSSYSTADPAAPADRRRDRTELELVRLARERRLPTYGICRGMQIVNIALGGTLIADLPATTSHPRIDADFMALRHRIELDADWLRATFPGVEAVVNSIHHQGLDRVADGLRPVAWAEDGVVEAVEAVDPDWFFRGVQWHPEKMRAAGENAHRTALFAQFAAAVRARPRTWSEPTAD